MNTSFINNQLNYIQMDREKEIEKMYSNGYPNGFGKRKHIDSLKKKHADALKINMATL